MQETWLQSLGQEDPLEEGIFPVFLPGKFHGQRSLEGYSIWACKSQTWLSDCTTTTKLVLLCFALLPFMGTGFFVFFFFSPQLKACGNPAYSKSIPAIFPIAFAHFVSLCKILVILRGFQTFSLLLYLSWWSVISDLWCYCCHCFGVFLAIKYFY